MRVGVFRRGRGIRAHSFIHLAANQTKLRRALVVCTHRRSCRHLTYTVGLRKGYSIPKSSTKYRVKETPFNLVLYLPNGITTIMSRKQIHLRIPPQTLELNNWTSYKKKWNRWESVRSFKRFIKTWNNKGESVNIKKICLVVFQESGEHNPWQTRKLN